MTITIFHTTVLADLLTEHFKSSACSILCGCRDTHQRQLSGIGTEGLLDFISNQINGFLHSILMVQFRSQFSITLEIGHKFSFRPLTLCEREGSTSRIGSIVYYPRIA